MGAQIERRGSVGRPILSRSLGDTHLFNLAFNYWMSIPLCDKDELLQPIRGRDRQGLDSGLEEVFVFDVRVRVRIERCGSQVLDLIVWRQGEVHF